jgi:catechol 2,3-dioxygenase-like lactoylglutathione lyase family enzyme
MLGDHPVHPVLLARDLEASGAFYRDALGLEVLVERPGEAIEFRCGDTKLVVTSSTTGTADAQTQLGWVVPDLEAELADLRARGIRIENYDFPGLRTVDGVVDLGFARMAWIVDPGGNALAIEQMNE